MAEPDLSIVSAHLDARQQLRAWRPRDAPPKLVFLPEPSGAPLAALDAQVSAGVL